MSLLPPVVDRARSLAAQLGFEKSCRDDVGRLLHVLAARRGVERAAEAGGGTGLGTARIASALGPGIPLFTAELDRRHAEATSSLFEDDPDVHVLHGDWRVMLPPEAPFDLLFVAGGQAKDEVEAVLALAVPGATLVLDDVSADGAGPDPRRARWLGHERLTAVVVGTEGNAQGIVAVVRR